MCVPQLGWQFLLHPLLLLLLLGPHFHQIRSWSCFRGNCVFPKINSDVLSSADNRALAGDLSWLPSWMVADCFHAWLFAGFTDMQSGLGTKE